MWGGHSAIALFFLDDRQYAEMRIKGYTIPAGKNRC